MPGYSRLAKMLRSADSVLVLGHQNADPDAVCSAFAFSALARRLNKKLTLSFSAPEGVSKLSKQILTQFPLEMIEHPNPASFDVIVTVDTNTLQQLGDLKPSIMRSGKPLIMIDHHTPHPESQQAANYMICEESSTSTCEMILRLHKQLHVQLSKKVSQVLLIGLLVETGHLSIATRKTFCSVFELIKSGADPENALAATRTSMDESERIARLKSAQRLRIERVGKWVIALSEVGSFHASGARALIGIGAHVAIVAGKRDRQVTMSLRSTKDFATQTRFHLGRDLAKPIGANMAGMGGGHATAAGVTLQGDINQAFKLAMRLIRDSLIPSREDGSVVSGDAPAAPRAGVIAPQ